MFSVHQTHSWWIECRGITGVALWDLSLKLNAALKSHGEFHRDWFTECCGQCTLSIYDPTKLGTIKRCEMIEDVAVKQFFGATSSWMEAVMMSSQWRERECRFVINLDSFVLSQSPIALRFPFHIEIQLKFRQILQIRIYRWKWHRLSTRQRVKSLSDLLSSSLCPDLVSLHVFCPQINCRSLFVFGFLYFWVWSNGTLWTVPLSIYQILQNFNVLLFPQNDPLVHRLSIWTY